MFGSGIRLGNVCCTLAGYVIVRVVDPSQPDGFFLTRRAAGSALTYIAPGLAEDSLPFLSSTCCKLLLDHLATVHSVWWNAVV